MQTVNPLARHTRRDGDHRSLSRQLAATPKSAARARQLARAFVEDRVEEDALEELLLATSELVTNAVQFGDRQPIWLHLSLTPHQIAVTVTNGVDRKAGGQGRGHSISLGGNRSESRDLAERGRGLAIVREVSDELTVFRGRVTIVRAAKRLSLY